MYLRQLRHVIMLGMFFALSMATLHAKAADQCTDVNCDCAILPYDMWKRTCLSQEKRLKESCQTNKGKVVGYCSIHGPQAKPLPLNIDTAIKNISESDESAADLNKKIASLYWSFSSDLKDVKKHVKAKNFLEAVIVINAISRNTDTLFQIQKQAVNTWKADGAVDRIRPAWIGYAEDTLNHADDLYTFGKTLWNEHKDSKTKDTSARDVGYKLIQVAGTAFEQAGYSAAMAVRNKDAANAWKLAAEASAMILPESIAVASDGSQADFYRFQTAARLHRASYHWVIGSGRGSAKESLEASQGYMDKDDGKTLDSLVDDEKKMEAARPDWMK